MSTVIGQRIVRGGAVKCHTAGNGLGRTIASSLIGSLGNALVGKIAKAVKGDGFKLTKLTKVGRPKKR